MSCDATGDGVSVSECLVPCMWMFTCHRVGVSITTTFPKIVQSFVCVFTMLIICCTCSALALHDVLIANVCCRQ